MNTESDSPYLPLLIKDVATDFNVSPMEVCRTLAKLGMNVSVNTAVTKGMMIQLRDYYQEVQSPNPVHSWISVPRSITPSIQAAMDHAIRDGMAFEEPVSPSVWAAALEAVDLAKPGLSPIEQQWILESPAAIAELMNSINLDHSCEVATLGPSACEEWPTKRYLELKDLGHKIVAQHADCFGPDILRTFDVSDSEPESKSLEKGLEGGIEKLAVRYESFGFGCVDERGFTTHGFDPEGLSAFTSTLLRMLSNRLRNDLSQLKWRPIETAPKNVAILVRGGIWASKSQPQSRPAKLAFVEKRAVDEGFVFESTDFPGAYVTNPTGWIPIGDVNL